MDQELKKQLSKIANTVRELSMEAVQKANSGHPGTPMAGRLAILTTKGGPPALPGWQ